MKRHLVFLLAALGITASSLLVTSCGSPSVDTHQMGPPGKSRTMADEDMPSRAGRY